MSTEKIDELESELKILKNEIQTVLIDVREHVLSYNKNPFQMVSVRGPQGDPETEVTANVGGSGGGGAEPIVERNVPAKASQEHGGGATMEATPEGSSQLKALMEQLEQERQALNEESPDSVPPPEQSPLPAMSPGLPEPDVGAMGSPGMSGHVAPGAQPVPPSREMPNFQALPGGMPNISESMPMEDRQSTRPGILPRTGRMGEPGGRTFADEDSWIADKRGGSPGSSRGADDGRGIEPHDQGHETDQEAQGQRFPVPGKEVNLLTLVGLVRWVEKSVKKIGKEKLEAIVEIYRTAGYLPENYNDVITQVMRLAEGEKPEGPVTMGHSISTLLQLDGLMGGRFQTESSILSTIFTEDGGDPWTKR